MSHIRLLLIVVIVTLSTVPLGCCGYRILGLFPLNARNHMMMFEQLMKGLARRGHQVDVVNTFPQKTLYPNYTDIIIPSDMGQLVNNLSYDMVQYFINNDIELIAKDAGNQVCETRLEYPEIQRLIKNPPNDPPYDLFITEVFGAHCFMAFGRHLKVPVVGVSSSALYPWSNDYVANPENFAFVPNNMIKYIDNINFWNRLYNFVHATYWKVYFNYYTSIQTELVKKYFGSDTPDIRELERELALILTNTHNSLNGVKPTTPALVEVGGLHIQDEDSDIPVRHKSWLDESEDGFIYFTFGSMVTIESFPRNILEILYKSLGKIAPIRVFMKVPNPELLPPGLPENVRTFDWMPQLEVLKHKNIRAFITHGGLLSTQEAVFCAVPMISIPLFGDQYVNTDLYVKKKIAIPLDYQELTEEKLDVALNEVLHNPIYKETVKQVSDKFLDRTLSPMDEACYWVEYVIRHGSKALRSPALDFTWWQIALLDVYLTLIITGIIALIILIYVVQLLVRIAFDYSQIVSTSKKTK